MNKDDPRINHLDDPKITQFPNYAFPLGFELKYQKTQPANELLPMMYNAGEEKIYMQFLIFYESLDEAYYPAYLLYQDVLEEIDNIDFQTGLHQDNSMETDPLNTQLEIVNDINILLRNEPYADKDDEL